MRTCIHPFPTCTHQPLHTYTNLHTTNIPILQTHLHPTYLPYPYIPTLHTRNTPTNLQNPTNLPYPYIPTLPLQTLHPILHACPIPAHLLYEHAVRWCGCVLPVMRYYVLRHLFAKLLYLNLNDFLRASWRRQPEEGRGVEFPGKSAILADCTTIIITTHYNTLQHIAAHYNTHCSAVQHSTTRVGQHFNLVIRERISTYWQTATHCNTLQHAATHCNMLQQNATRCIILQTPRRQHTASHCNTLQHTATHCNIPQHTATHCNTLQHTATRK